MNADVRSELRRLFSEHLDRPFPACEWGELEERFGVPDAHADVLAVDGAHDLLSQWGATDLILYDTYVAGHVSRVLRGETLGVAVTSDERLTRYLDLCEAGVLDDATRASVEACRSYVEQLNEMLELARHARPR